MSETKNGGIVTAYGAAKRGGYQGTYSQFCEAMADLGIQVAHLEGMTVEINMQSAGTTPSASYNSTNGTLTLNLPKGDTGDKGDKGDTGSQGDKGDKGDTGYPTDEQVSSAVGTWLGENVDPTTGYVLDRTLTQEDAAAPADLVGELKSAITTHGINLLNPDTVTTGKIITATGEETTLSIACHSDYIEVEPNTEIYISRGLGSSSRITLLEYNANKEPINAITKSNTAAFKFTTTENTHFIIYNVATAYLDSIIIAYNTTTYAPFTISGNSKTDDCKLYSVSQIFYNNENLFSDSDIYLITKSGVINFGNTITVGSGQFLLFNNTTQKLVASNFSTEYFSNPDVFIVANLKHEVSFLHPFCAWIAHVPPLTLDAINKTIRLYTRDQSYIYYNHTYITISTVNQTLTYTTNHCLLLYETDNKVFRTEASYNDIKVSDIIIAEIYFGNIVAICEVIKLGQIPSVSASLFTYGDSLTWYNGNTFNRGADEGNICHGFQDYLGAYTGVTLYSNRGSSGDTTPEIYNKIVQNHDFASGTDVYITIMGGDNDDRLSTPIGEIAPKGSTFDTTTVYGALQASVELIINERPDAHLIIMTEPIGWTYRNGAFVRVNENIAQAYRDVAYYYGLPLIDLWRNSGINEMSRSEYMNDLESSQDYIYHPNNKGWKRISRYICMEIGRC